MHTLTASATAPPTTRPHLPARVRQRIDLQEAQSEILVGWIQLAIVVGFAIVYTLAPKTYSANAPFHPVPWALSAYFAFTVLRLVLAHRRALPTWLRYASIVVDMSLLLGLIWSFHLQYQQPASFFLKSPTLLYVFIFIALRALAFDARYVVVAGAVAAAGWLLLVLYVVTIDPHDTMITRDYVHYLTSNSVLIGAEVDKVLTILVVTVVLGFAIRRSYRLLEASVVESASNRDLARFVPTDVVARINAAEEDAAAGQGELAEATVLFLDLEGFTTLSERLSPDALVRTLNDFYAAAEQPIVAADGVINQFQGDAIVATFNVPRANPAHAANAVRAARDIEAMVSARTFGDGVRLGVRMGINTGRVVGGLIGTPQRLVYTVIGDDVNVAARLEALNKEYGTRILVSDRTRQAAGAEAFPFVPIGDVQVRGRSTATPIWSVATAPR